MVKQIETQHAAQLKSHHPSNHIFATVDLLRAIVNFYGAVYVKKEGHLWDSPMKIENKIIIGEVGFWCHAPSITLGICCGQLSAITDSLW
jgi:hypothetical protein